MKNTRGKTVKRSEAYEVWQTPDGSWTWYVLKAWQGDDDKPFARWFCDVVTPMCPNGEMGDVYVSDVKANARRIDVVEQTVPAWLAHHLQHNHFPPVDLSFAEAALEAIHWASCGEWDELIDLPNGNTVRVFEVIDGLHLEEMVDADEEGWE